MGSISRGTDQQARDGATIHESRAFARLRTFKQGLVLDLFLRRGAFWESVRGLREERGLTSSVQLPPNGSRTLGGTDTLLPADAPEHPGFRAPPKEKLDFFEFSSRCVRRYRQHHAGSASRRAETCPRSSYPGSQQFLRRTSTSERSARPAYSTTRRRRNCWNLLSTATRELDRAGDLSDARSLVTKRVEMKMHPIEELPIRSEELQKLERFYETLLAEIAERLEPRGIDLQSTIEDIHREHPQLRRKLQEEVESSFYINVDEYTTERRRRGGLPDHRSGFAEIARGYQATAQSIGCSPMRDPTRSPQQGRCLR